MTALSLEIREAVLAALKSDEGRAAIREAVRGELRAVADDELIDVDAAAKLTGRSVAAVYRAANRGSIPSVKQGGKLRFRRSDLLGGAR